MFPTQIDRGEALFLPPSIWIRVAFLEFNYMVDGISNLAKIFKLFSTLVTENKSRQAFYQACLKQAFSLPILQVARAVYYNCHAAFAFLKILKLTDSFWRPFAASLLPGIVKKPIDIAQKQVYIQDFKNQMTRWSEKLKNTPCSTSDSNPPCLISDKEKNEIAVYCKSYIQHFKEILQETNPLSMQFLRAQFHDTSLLFRANILGKIAEENYSSDEVKNSTIDFLILTQLGAQGLTNADFKIIAQEIGWNEEEHDTYLSLKFAEKKLFSLQDPQLVGIKTISTTKEEKIKALVSLLKDETSSASPERKNLELIKRIAKKIDYIAASIFTIFIHSLGILMIYQIPFSWNCLHLIDGLYFGYYGYSPAISRSEFVNSGLEKRLEWVGHTLAPLTNLTSVVIKTLRGPGLKNLPSALYKTYLA